jgi:hypothetical protein
MEKTKIEVVLILQPPTSFVLLRDVHHTEGKPVAYHSKKLNSAQMNYATIDKELLCVVATLCEFRSMMLGAEIHVHNDQKILELHYAEGPRNVIADTFSKLLHSKVSSPLVGKKATNVVSNSESNNRNESSYPEWYSCKIISNVEDILCYTKPGDNLANWKAALPEDLIKPTIKWYHQVTGHTGSKRLHGQLQQRYYHRDLPQMVDNLNCDFCQRNKLDNKGYEYLPEREVQSLHLKHALGN